MVLTANSLAKQAGCAWTTVKRAIARGELTAVWDEKRRAWVIEDVWEMLHFKARLDKLEKVRRERKERLKALWRIGRLRPRKRKNVQVVVAERVKRPMLVSVGQGIYSRSVPISWDGDEGSFCCPSCAASLKIR